jgi:hypothetical protein
MPYTRAQAIEFWFDFDNRSNPGFGQVHREVLAAYRDMGGLDFPIDRFHEHRAAGTWPVGFVQDMLPLRRPLSILVALQESVLTQHFGTDEDAERLAFEDFGQGVLFDNRRPVGDKVHKMDGGGPSNPPVGYHRWYGVIRASVFAEAADEVKWLRIARNVGLAWAIQSEAKPVDDSQQNPELPRRRLEELRAFWQSRSFDSLDGEFDKDPYP